MSREEYQSFLSFGGKPWDDERNLPENLGDHPHGMMEYWKSGILRIERVGFRRPNIGLLPQATSASFS